MKRAMEEIVKQLFPVSTKCIFVVEISNSQHCIVLVYPSPLLKQEQMQPTT